MATWGEFIAEIPIINKRAEGIFVKADHVLDLWEERNRLQAELAKLQAGGNGAETAGPSPIALASPVGEAEPNQSAAQERERCAREIEEFAETCPVDPAWRELAVQLLRTAAQMLREKANQGEEKALESDMSFLENVVIPPAAAAPVSEPELPMAEPVSDDSPPMAEPVTEGEVGHP